MSARGSYGAAEYKASFRASERRRFASETPKDRRFPKTDLAKYLNAWNGLPHQVSFGSQKNFQSFMQAMKEQYPDGYVPDEEWFRTFIAKAILFRATQAIVKAQKFPAYQANIVAYTVACISWKSGGRIDFERVWTAQSISVEMREMITKWAIEVDKHLRRTAGSRMVSEWAKKLECWEITREVELPLRQPLPPEMQVQRSRSTVNGIKQPKLTPGDMRTTRGEQSYQALEQRQRDRGLDHTAKGNELAP
jgi:hypothetical protein